MNVKEQIVAAARHLENGDIILYPTDTIWGIGCDATNEKAVEKIYALKKRPGSKSMIVLVQNVFALANITDTPIVEVNEFLASQTKPTTIIYPAAKNIAQNLIADDGTIAVRIPANEFCKNLLTAFKKPLVSTSANISGANTPVVFDDIDSYIKNGVDFCFSNTSQVESNSAKASSIYKLDVNGTFTLIRA